MKHPFTALFRARGEPQDSVSSAPTFFFGANGSGKPVNANTATQLSAVYACVRMISETVASLPLGVYETEKDGIACLHPFALDQKEYILQPEQHLNEKGCLSVSRVSASSGTPIRHSTIAL